MIHNELAASRRDAMEQLQERLLKYSDPYWDWVYEKALELSLSEKRSVPPDYFLRLLADARRTIKRNRQGIPELASFYIRNEDGDEIVDDTLGANEETPEQMLYVKQVVQLIEKACSKRHKLSRSVFHSMLDGYTVAETAKYLSISPSMVKKLRVEIIDIAKKVISY